MGTSKNKAKKTRDDKHQTYQNGNEEQLPIPWKISLLLTFLAIVVICLFQSENNADIANANKKSQQVNQQIPDPEISLPPSMSKLYIFNQAAISSDSQLCSDIARNLMREKSGNVFDATISLLICNSLTNIQSMGIYGGFLLSAYSHDIKKAFIIDAQLTVPEKFPSTINNISDVKEGPLSIAIFSGFLKGLREIYKAHATIPWHDLIEPTVHLCRNGFILTKHLRDSLEYNQAILLNDPYIKSIFIDSKTNKIKRVGSKIVNTKHCNFLEILAVHDVDNEEIISGKIEEIITNDLETAECIITINDLKSYKLNIYERELIDLNDDTSMIIPESAAILIPSILKIIKSFNFNSTWFEDSNLSLLLHHRVTEVFKYVFALRSKFGDGETEKYLLSDKFADHVIKSIDDEIVKTDVEDYGVEFISPKEHGTSHISIVDKNGNAVSITSSINFYFGAGISGNASGIIFNNGMDDFSYPQRSVNYFGLQETPLNYPRKGKRALSSMSPIILIDRKTQLPTLVIGAAGGSKIISALSTAILRFMCCTRNIKEIIDAPRFHHQMIPNVFEYEYGVTSGIISGLKAKGHETSRYRYRGTIINALLRNFDSIHAISDYRKDSSGVAGF